jgi:penicillin-insensitive murein endopeptidase
LRESQAPGAARAALPKSRGLARRPSRRINMRLFAALLAAALLAPPALAQDLGSLHPKPLPPLAHPDDPSLPAKQLFGRETKPTQGPSKVIGFYAKGCLAGARRLPYDGPSWQVMRPSRNRNWGHPVLIDFIERVSRKLRDAGIWPGFLVGDMAQPRGGPMITGHASHQIGLDADIWLTPMPERRLTREEREDMSATNVVRKDRRDVDYSRWTPAHMALIKGIAQQPEVQRMFVNPAIKKAICRDAQGDRSWLAKVRPMYGHDYHTHIRLACPAGESECRHQAPVPEGDSCDASLAWWFKDSVLHPRPNPHYRPKPGITMAALPSDCRAVLNAP